MLQQTRVAAVLPYYERFLERFPDVGSLAAAPESNLLAAWSGLGYYSRARNLQKAARSIMEQGAFPASYVGIRALAGVGDYTAAAIASIAFGLPHAVVDGNVLRVLARLSNDGGDIGSSSVKARLTALANELLDVSAPGEHNQAVMELGATVCLPKRPQCLLCPVAGFCEARTQDRAAQLPIKLRRSEPVFIEKSLLKIERGTSVLMWQRPAESVRMPGFWELPESTQLPRARVIETIGKFRHTITHHNFRFTVLRAEIRRLNKGFEWIEGSSMDSLPVSTITRKALALKKK
jgi:A/G-specific adenine glycosylase